MGHEELRAAIGLTFFVMAVAMIMAVRRRSGGGRRGRGRFRPGPGTAGAVYDLLNQDKRRAIEIIVEERAEERDPETVDGNLPALEAPEGPASRGRLGRGPVL